MIVSELLQLLSAVRQDAPVRILVSNEKSSVDAAKAIVGFDSTQHTGGDLELRVTKFEVCDETDEPEYCDMYLTVAPIGYDGFVDDGLREFAKGFSENMRENVKK